MSAGFRLWADVQESLSLIFVVDKSSYDTCLLLEYLRYETSSESLFALEIVV